MTNALSVLSLLAAYSFLLVGIGILRRAPREPMAWTAALVNFCFGFWSFCYSFFYGAQTLESAWFWHRLSALGWIPFCVFAVHFFLQLAEFRWRGPGFLVALYTLPVALLFLTFQGNQTPAALSLIPSPAGWGWTYVSSIETPLYWIFVAYLVGYFVFGLTFVFLWGRTSGRLRFRKQARALIALDCAVMTIGLYTDLFAPALSHDLPPLANFLAVVWMVGFMGIIRNFKLMTVHEAASADLILDTVLGPVLLLDKGGRVAQCNQATARLLGWPPDEILGQPFSKFFRSGAYDPQNVEKLLAVKKLGPLELELIDAQGQEHQVQAAFSVAESALDGIVGIVVNLNDITSLKAVEKELENLANSDKLTGLPNRRRFFLELDAAIEAQKTSGAPFALVFTDLDGFKPLNDKHGHDFGDQALVVVGQRLNSLLGPGDLAARVGGDEFVLLVRSPETLAALSRLADRLAELFQSPIPIAEKACALGISLGISRCPEDGTEPDALVQAADQRMYRDKRAHRRKPHDHFRTTHTD